MSNQHEWNIVKYLSVIFHANNYPMSKTKLRSIAKGIFNDEQVVLDILQEFKWSGDLYWLNSNGLLSVHNVSDAIYKTLLNWEKSSYVWALCLLYNSPDNKTLFYELLKKNSTQKRRNILSEFIKEEILNVKENKYIKNNGYLNARLNTFSDYHRLSNHFSPFEANACLGKLLSVNRELKCIPWNEMIEFLPHNFLKFLYNFNCSFYKKPINYYLKQIRPTSSDDFISLAILNAINTINENERKDKNLNGFKQIFFAIRKLPKERMFYWYGLILSNMEYCLIKTDDIPLIFDNMAQKELLNILKKSKINVIYIESLKRGLDTTSRHCYLKHFIVYQDLIRTNENLAIKLAKEILADYTKKVNSQDNYNLCIHSRHETEYCNAVIHALKFLSWKKKVNIYKVIDKWYSAVHLNKEEFGFNYSKLIEQKNKTLHLFVVALFALENLKHKKIAIDEKYLNRLLKMYFDYINNFIEQFDQQEWFSITNILNLQIIKGTGYIDDEIKHIYNSSNPNFELLSFLLNKNNKYEKHQYVIEFIEDFFQKYNQYWDIHKYETWLRIWTNLNNQKNINICLDKLPEWQRREYLKNDVKN